LTVSHVLSKMADQEKVEIALEEAKEAKAVAEKVLHEKQMLQHEISSGAGIIKLNYLIFELLFYKYRILIFIVT
jgi:hypothetical protein